MATRVDVLVRAVPDGVGSPWTAGLDPREYVDRVAACCRCITYLQRFGPLGPTGRRARGADEDLPLARIGVADAPDDDEVARAVHREHREESVWRAGRCVGDLDQLCEIRPGGCRIQEVQCAGRIGRPDVEEDAVRDAAAVRGAPGRLEDLSGDLIDRRIAIGAKRRVDDTGGWGLTAGRVDEGEPVGAHIPLRSSVRTGTNDIVVCEVDQRGLAARGPVRGLVRRPRGGVVDRQPLPVGTGDGGATSRIYVLLVGCS